MKEHIVELKEKEKIDELLRLLQEGDEKTRADASKALGMMKASEEREDVTTALVERLKKDDIATVRANAALALGQIGSEIGKKALKEAAEEDDWEVRHDVAIAMGEYQDECFIDPLYSLLEDSETEVKAKSIESLGKIAGEAKSTKIVLKLQNFLDHPYLKEEAVKAISNAESEKALEALMQAYQDGEREIREIAINGIGKIQGKKADELLIQALKDNSWRVREDAAKFLGERGCEEALEPLLKRLNDKKNYVVQEALKAVGSIGKKDEKVLEKIEQKLEDDDPETRTAAAEALEKIDHERAAETLFNALKIENNPRVLWSISDSLSKRSRKELKELKGKTKELGVEREMFAVFAMGKAGSSRQVNELLSMLDDERWKVRQKAAEALRGIDAEELSESKSKKILKKLSKTMEDNDKWVRSESVKSLGEILFDLKGKWDSEEFEKKLLKRAEVEADEDVIDVIKQVRNLLDI